MLNVVVTDLSAHARHKLVDSIHSLLRSNSAQAVLLPKLTVRPLAAHEITSTVRPQLLIIGAELIAQDLTEISRIRRALPDAFIIVQLTEHADDLTVFETMVHQGADDIISENIDADSFIKRLVLLSQKKPEKKSGTLILLDSGKGGSGTTSIAAALAHQISQEKRVAVIDLDFETQDLTRFLRVRPFVNEHLQLLLNKTRHLNQDLIEQCLSQVFPESESLACLAPASESEELFNSRSNQFRLFFQLLQTIDSIYDVHIVDAASARGSLLRTLYRVSDKVLFVVQNDPASVHASIQKLKSVISSCSLNTELHILINCIAAKGFPVSYLKSEIKSHCRELPVVISECVLPYCSKAQRWPGSGTTMAELSGRRFRNSLLTIQQQLGFESTNSDYEWQRRFFDFRNILSRQLPIAQRVRTLPSQVIEAAPIASSLSLPLISSHAKDF